MFYFFVYIIISAIAIFSSFPIAKANGIPYLDILTDYLSYTTFSGVLCAFIMLYARNVTKIKFNPNNKFFQIPKWEQRFYERIKVEKWKKLIPDFGKMVKFKKKIDFSQAKNAAFYHRFIYENINASILHFVDILLTPIFFVFLHKEFYITIGICGMLMIFILNIMPVMLQRYLRPRFIRIYNRLKAQEEKAEKKSL